MKTLTKTELIDLLSKVKGTTPISIETTTVPKIKAGNPFTALKKVSKVAGLIGFIYGNSVNNQREREGVSTDFKPEERKWGQRILHSPLVKHKDKYYLELKVQGSSSEYFDNETRVNSEDVKPFYYSNSSRQGVNKEVILRDYDINNISRITINKNEYKVC
jgi:hypothetical protein